MEKIITYQGPNKKLGIDDLKETYIFLCTAQGDEIRTNDPKYYVNSKGWLRINPEFRGINIYDTEDIEKRSQELKDYNEDYIEALKSMGKYGKEVPGHSITLQHNPMFDDVRIINRLNSYRFNMINFNS
jgi:hypothetical protein